MKFKESLLLLFVLGSMNLFAQSPSTQQSINAPSLTAVLPPAPNAFQLTKYSGLPLSLSSGTANATIPLGEVKDGSLSVPISISYNSGNGVKVNQLASRVGVNWTLNAGGVISRTVFGKPDESTKWLTPPAGLSSGSSTPEAYNYLDSATKDMYDTQADIFSFECNGYSGKFYLKPTEKTKAIQLTTSPLRIETNFNNEFSADWTIRITDPNGTKYYFGGSSATEKTKTVPYGATCGKSFDVFIPTAWYLKKIEGIHGEQIVFGYTAVSFDYLADVSETMIRTPQGTLTTAACPQGTCPQRIENQICASNLRSQGVLLISISGGFTSTDFHYTQRSDIDGDMLLDQIKYFSHNSADPTVHQVPNIYSLSYNYSFNNSYYNSQGSPAILCSRPFLMGVIRSPAEGGEPERHSFDYYNMNGLPSRLSFAQDYWGFPNGKNNQSLLPTSSDASDAQLFPAYANREPDAAFSLMGLLRKITYPTGGADSLEYESNTVFDTRTPQVARTTLREIRQGTGNSNAVSYSTIISLGSAQSVGFDYSCQYSGTGVDDQIHQHAILDVRDQYNNSVYNHLLRIGQNYSKQLLLTPGTYNITWTAYGQAAIGELSFGYYPQGSPVSMNYEAGGVRVVRNISIPTIGRTLRKRLIYTSLESQGISSGLLRETPDTRKYYANLIDGKNCPDWSVSQCTYRIANSTPIDPLNYISGSHIFYREVTEVDDEQWKNGGTAHHYLGSQGWNALQVRGSAMQGLPLTSYGFQTGLEDQTRDFYVTGSNTTGYTYKVVREVKKHYVSDLRKLTDLDNFVVKRRYLPTLSYSPPNESMFVPFDVAMFSHVGSWVYSDTTTVTEYDPQGNNPMVSRTVEVYNNTDHFQPNRILSNLSDGRESEMNIKYAHEMVADGNLNAYSDLVANNRITTPIIKTDLAGGNHVQSLFTEYQDWGNGNVEPVNAKLSVMGGPYNNFVSFDAYDSQGKLLTQSKSGGAKSSFKYGYRNKLPIVECSNALSSEFFFENFEDLTSAQLGTGHTGERYQNGDYTLGWVPPNGRQYRITYFYLENSRWKYAQQAYMGPMTLTLGDAVDDVAIYPTDASLKSITMDPNVGITAMVDEKGNTVYYEYDAFDRLLNVRDQNRDITKTYAYHQLFGFNSSVPVFYNLEQSQSFTKECTMGAGSSLIYAVAAGSYSSSISQADANGQAMAEVNSNGQAYANAQGTCSTANTLMEYYKDTQGSSSGITTLSFKNGSGVVIYSFTEAQLLTGISVPPGVYNLEFTTYGSTYNISTHNGWTKVNLYGPTYQVAGSFYNTNAVGGTYTLNNINMVGGTFHLSMSRFDAVE
ncbi:hypothetical protein EZ449_15410 [Pedobacter frigidisoli]|uniref:DUF5977 domain-containing protein n=1 Tax=Pedobacter frigidisoli TaxID=2530455 RepID=A0A4R0NVZ0_9SPHI|nr:DUF5977 domain-containing protein [Pedobacter frigidisoli]TCD05851.1 hypothetical protein EZ449_15410 [Pedobacter frigidisoli]